MPTSSWASARGRRCHGAYPGVREPIGVGEAHVRPVHLSLERLRGQSRRALPQLQSAQVRETTYFFSPRKSDWNLGVSGSGCVLAPCAVLLYQAPEGHPAWAGERGGRLQEAHCAGASGHPHGEDHQGRRGEPQEPRPHLLKSWWMARWQCLWCEAVMDLAKRGL